MTEVVALKLIFAACLIIVSTTICISICFIICKTANSDLKLQIELKDKCFKFTIGKSVVRRKSKR